jgi:hypothetical protein
VGETKGSLFVSRFCSKKVEDWVARGKKHETIRTKVGRGGTREVRQEDERATTKSKPQFYDVPTTDGLGNEEGE